jgi:hypothetical protein
MDHLRVIVAAIFRVMDSNRARQGQDLACTRHVLQKK